MAQSQLGYFGKRLLAQFTSLNMLGPSLGNVRFRQNI